MGEGRGREGKGWEGWGGEGEGKGRQAASGGKGGRRRAERGGNDRERKGWASLASGEWEWLCVGRREFDQLRKKRKGGESWR